MLPSLRQAFNEQYNAIRSMVQEQNQKRMGTRLRVALTGLDSNFIAGTALGLMEEGHQVILKPEPDMQFPVPIDIQFDMNRYQINVVTATDEEIRAERRRYRSDLINEWDVAMYTSGTTGRAKPIGVKRSHMDFTIRQYEKIYGIDQDSLILTSLPASYNFTFVAGVYQSQRLKNQYRIVNDRDISTILRHEGERFSRVVVLGNPVVLQRISDDMDDIKANLLVDSGGAPLSTEAIRLYRAEGINLREGYGLTETCSLTHFDAEGLAASLGTVGTPVNSRIICRATPDRLGNKVLQVRSPNIGINLMDCPDRWPKEINTQDIVRIDDQGRTRIRGRSVDREINGMWPRDTLDLIGPLLKKRCAAVRHYDNGLVSIRVLGDIKDRDRDKIRNAVKDALKIDDKSLYMDAYNDAMLHSIKLPSPNVK